MTGVRMRKLALLMCGVCGLGVLSSILARPNTAHAAGIKPWGTPGVIPVEATAEEPVNKELKIYVELASGEYSSAEVDVVASYELVETYGLRSLRDRTPLTPVDPKSDKARDFRAQDEPPFRFRSKVPAKFTLPTIGPNQKLVIYYQARGVKEGHPVFTTEKQVEVKPRN